MNNKQIKDDALKIMQEKRWPDVGAYATFEALVSVAGSCYAIFFVGGALEAGYTKYLVNRARKNEEGKFTDVFAGFKNFWKNCGTMLLMTLFICLWGLLFFIPGIIKAIAYSMTFFVLEDHPEYTPMQAMLESEKMMFGHKWQYFCLIMRFFGWALLSALTLGILGVLYVGPWMNMSAALFYEELKKEAK